MHQVAVAASELPPVEERLPNRPYVLEVNESPGVYGGAWRTAYPRSSYTDGPDPLAVHCGLTCFDRDLTVRPYVAESWELDEQGMTITWHLRPGMRWSDGEPVTTQDFWFYWMGGADYPDRIGHYGLEERIEIDLVDDYTCTFAIRDATKRSPLVQPVSYAQRALSLPLVPTEHARRYHPDYAPGGARALQALAEQEGYGDWPTLYRIKVMPVVQEPGKPTLWPWRLLTKRRAQAVLLERNPYFWQVDAEGRQLPYLDHVVCRQFAREDALEMMIENGELDCQVDRLLPQREESYLAAGYIVRHFASGEHIVLQVNPSTRNGALAEFWGQRDVRRALSIGINRADLAVLYDDRAVGRQYSPIPRSPLYGEELARQYTEYDPDRANQMLDAAGYAARDYDGYRLSPDGQRLEVIVQSPYHHESVGGRLVGRVCEDLEALGLDCDYWEREAYRIRENFMQGVLDATIGPLSGAVLPALTTGTGFFGSAVYNVWRGRGTFPDTHYFHELSEVHEAMIQEGTLEGKMALCREYLAIWRAELPHIGLLGEFEQPGIAREGFLNLQDGLVYDTVTGEGAFQNPQQFSWYTPAAHALSPEELEALVPARSAQ